MVVLQNIKPTHDRTFVISRPTTNEPAVGLWMCCKVERVPVYSIPFIIFAGLENSNVNESKFERKETYGHNVIVIVDENCLLIGVILATPAFDYWWQVFFPVFICLLDELGLEFRENVELFLKPYSHILHLLALFRFIVRTYAIKKMTFSSIQTPL